ncbi:hypothetical protein JJB09_16935 [Rhizobium sp. KVB221]|uniref:Bifunctional riboflavin kinase/FMN adenylyltransferase n=1 Tax=Rhizobium setariae TaxID=2801340 RepID=A0A936YNB1_9HYPH|nr:hypothetical protein [Rhizobium setariae]MBL0373709.1 hypothetical protein [Rhizobium setariae]
MASTSHAYPLFGGTTDLPDVVTDDLASDHPLRNAVLALGNFDGFHLGHQALAGMAHRLAAGRPVAVMSCEPHPRSFFCKENAPFRLATPATKRWQLGQYGVDFIYSPLFDHAFAGLSPIEFVDRILVDALGVRGVIAGPDFRFGNRRAGDMSLLSELGAARGFSVSIAPDITHAGVRVSSTLIRAAIQAGDLHGASRLLGHGWLVETRQTPNGGLKLHHDLCKPRAGRYVGFVDGPDGRGERRCIDITSAGEFLPLGPQAVRATPTMWRLEAQVVRKRPDVRQVPFRPADNAQKPIR